MNWTQFALFFGALLVVGVIGFQRSSDITNSCQENRDLIADIEKDLAKAREERGEVALSIKSHRKAVQIQNDPC